MLRELGHGHLPSRTSRSEGAAAPPRAASRGALTRSVMLTQLIEENGKGRKYTQPVSQDTIMAYMTYLSESPETYAVPAQGLAEQVTLTGRGLAFPSVRAALWAIGSVHEDMGFSNPTAVRVIKRRMDEMGRKHVAVGAPAYDIVEVRIRRAEQLQRFDQLGASF